MREIILDIETTGLDYKNGHKIIEIGCFELIDKEMGMSYHQYINPKKQHALFRKKRSQVRIKGEAVRPWSALKMLAGGACWKQTRR